jgi:translation initiation factor 1 (eIF-1/SUI1)
MTYKTIYTEVEVDVDISEFDTEDLIEELESRCACSNEFGDGK